MKKFIIQLLVCVFCMSSYAFSNHPYEKFYQRLDSVIQHKQDFEQQKIQRINQINTELQNHESRSLQESYNQLHNLQKEYFTFNYDSAMLTAIHMLNVSYQLKDPGKIAYSKIRISATLLASGIFNEAEDSLKSINVRGLSKELKQDYYYNCSRLYYDMADYYQQSYFVEHYVSLGNQYLDSAIKNSEKGSLEYYSFSGLKELRSHQLTFALANYEALFSQYSLSGRQLAIDACTYAYVLETKGRMEESIRLLIDAAIEDIKLANKEHVALMKLAYILYEEGDIIRSSNYLKLALNDADEYGALQRKFQISQMQPIIEAAKLNLAEGQKSKIKSYAVLITLLFLVIAIILFVMIRQFKKIIEARNEANTSNEALKSTNNQLREVNLIKEEYIGYFFNVTTEYVDKLEAFKQSIENKLLSNKVSEINQVVKKLNVKKEREAMYKSFDVTFLKIFPNFIECFNNLLEKEYRITEKEENALNTDLRIFALIRLGITDNDKIAHILNYSVNTINTYKTRIKNRSIVPNEEFENEIMQIQSI